MNFKRIIAAILVISQISVCSLFADEKKSTTPEPYKKNEFPGYLKDLRRAEIITLGAMPFVTFNVSLGYSFSCYALNGFNSNYFVNPFANASDDNAYSYDEQMAIIVTSLCISAGIGLTDFIVHAAKRNISNRKARAKKNGPIEINPIQEDPEAFKIKLKNQDEPEYMDNGQEIENTPEEIIIPSKSE